MRVRARKTVAYFEPPFELNCRRNINFRYTPFFKVKGAPDEKNKPSTRSRQEVKYYGFHACLKLWEARPADIIRVYTDPETAKQIGPLLKWCAAKKKAYHIVTNEEMAAISQSVHHEGLCILAKELPLHDASSMLQQLQTSNASQCILYLDGVQNPHNIGSIMRVCAHFGIHYLLGDSTSLSKVSPSTYRIAQGGAEAVNLVPIEQPKQTLAKLIQAGFKPVATSSHSQTSLYTHKFAPRTLLIMGAESEGITKPLLQLAKQTLTIPGTGLVESLNVSVATGLLLGEYWRQHNPS